MVGSVVVTIVVVLGVAVVSSTVDTSTVFTVVKVQLVSISPVHLKVDIVSVVVVLSLSDELLSSPKSSGMSRFDLASLVYN